VSTSAPTVVQARTLGRGLACGETHPGDDIGRDLVLTTGSIVDLAMVGGIENLDQCLAIALTTALGSDVFNTGFGFDGLNALIEETNGALVRERVRVAVINVLSSDPRVRSITDLNVDPSPNASGPDLTLAERIEVWRSLNVAVAFQAITGQQAIVNVGKVNVGA
jgi:phage baseplate assembly protein W